MLRDLLSSAVTDASCLLEYYAAEHFMTQMQLASQGTPTDGPPREHARFYRLELVRGAAALGGCELDDVRAYVPKGASRAELAAAAKVSLATVFGAAARLGLGATMGGTAACAAVPGGSSSSPRRARASASRRRLDM